MQEEEEEMRLKIFLEAENGEIVWSSEDYQEYKILSSRCNLTNVHFRDFAKIGFG